MGDHAVFSQSSGLQLNGLFPEKSASVSQVLDKERWLRAEEQTAELIARIQPNPSSEDRRNAVANYVQRLIMKCLSCRVFTFGSVPLKTYLPDGDIDLTAFSDNENLKDTWATTVCGALENEEKSENAEFQVKEVKYIQAEVKLIKCLVENIVVDISFNQVGGLCTLCFLEEMDKVINRNHLFKRSVILIKAWCYYESRILGAHHGLISTYALETLVLYIFHVFNNSFTGPLEVLYRFLQFFSNFDWGNYCISLWGPVPISSLPDMNAEPPRKDNGDLLFNKSFLDKCTAVYSVTPGSQENNIQPFLSKHFNVVDPLRTNNNLGRSVSKGNFFRIRTAFAYGAKRLARLLECPKDTITAEVSLFFMNTWTRDGAGLRPDVLNLDSRLLQPLESVPLDESINLKNSKGAKSIENGVLHVGEEHLPETGQSSHYFIPETHGNNENAYKSNNISTGARLQIHTSYRKQVNSRSTDQPERSLSSSGSVPSEKNQKVLKSNYSLNDQEEQARFPFARTRSSPELTETSFDFSGGRHGRAIETTKVQSTAKFDSSIRRKNMIPEITGSQSSKSSLDGYTLTSQKNLDASDANNVLNCHQGDFGFTNMREELASVSETLEMQQQDLVNMMGSSNIHNFNGQVPFPMHVAPYHLPLTLSPVSTSVGYVKRNLTRVLPSNLPLIGTPWGSNVQFAQSLAPFPLSHYVCAAPYSSNIDAPAESSNDGPASTELNLEDSDQVNWHEDNAVLSRGSNPGVSVPLDGNQQKEGNLISSPTARGAISGSLSQGYNKLSREDRSSTREDRNLTREDLNSSFQSKTGRAGDVHSSLRSSNTKYFPPLQASSSRSKYTSENLRDRSTTKNKSPRDRWGRKPAHPVSTSTYVKESSKLHYEASSDDVSTEVDDGNSGWIPLSTMGNDMPESITESVSSSSPHARNQHPLGYELVQNQSDSLFPLAPLLVGSSQQRAMDYSKLFTTFVPTGPPVPYLVFPTLGNFTPNTGNPDGYARQFDSEEESEQFKASSSDQNIDSVDSLDQSEAVMSPTVSRNSAPESSEEPSSDILNSDLTGHRENLVYGRFCQNPCYHGSFMYSPPAVGSPIYLSGNYPWDGHLRSAASNLNYTQITSPQLLPVMQLQSSPDRASGVFQRSVDEAPRYRGGTGTYLPNPKAFYRDRQTSSRNHRGNRNYDRNDAGDRQRHFDRSHGRNQVEKAGFRPDRPAAAAKKQQEEKRWDSYKQEPHLSYQGVDHAFASTNSSHNLDSAYGLYSQTIFSSNGGIPPDHQIPPVVFVCPFNQGVADGSSTEPLEFGSLRAVHPPLGNGAPPGATSDEITGGEPSDQGQGQRHSSYNRRGGSKRSSPDRQPTSPHLEM